VPRRADYWTGWFKTWGHEPEKKAPSPEHTAYGVLRFFASGGTALSYSPFCGGRPVHSPLLCALCLSSPANAYLVLLRGPPSPSSLPSSPAPPRRDELHARPQLVERLANLRLCLRIYSLMRWATCSVNAVLKLALHAFVIDSVLP